MNFWIVAIKLISTFLVLIGIFVFVFGKHKHYGASRRLFSDLKYNSFFLNRTKKDIADTWMSLFPLSANLHRKKHRITSVLRHKLCNWNTFQNMNDFFPLASQLSLEHKHRTISLKTKGWYTILGTRAYTLEQTWKFCYSEYVKW